MYIVNLKTFVLPDHAATMGPAPHWNMATSVIVYLVSVVTHAVRISMNVKKTPTSVPMVEPV